MNLPWLDAETPFPPTAQAWGEVSDAPGLLAAGGGLGVARLREAYARGIFPWYGAGDPLLWWSPAPRMVLYSGEFKLARSLRKTLGRFAAAPGCEIRFDHDFTAVMRACASAPRVGQAGTWIQPEMVAAYTRLHLAGNAHSVETWIDGELAGGLYLVSLGRMVYGESMFARRADASKIALAALVAFCRRHGIGMIDCQQPTRHLASLGARPVPRAVFEAHLRAAVPLAPPRWVFDTTLWQSLNFSATGASPAASGRARRTII